MLREFLADAQLREFEANEAEVANDLKTLDESDVSVVSWLDPDYPPRLRQRLGNKAPPVIFVRGALQLLGSPAVGFCGSRKASSKGLSVAADCAGQLAERGITIASGGAAGVDLHTHRAALEAGGSTIIVLAEGIDHFRIRRDLRDQWDWERVAVVTQFPPSSRWSVANAMQRNWTICALSRAMILIEARATGGSIATGRASLSLQVPLFAPVYGGMPEWAAGNRELIDKGAMPIKKTPTSHRANLASVMDAACRDSGGKSFARPAEQLPMFQP